MNATEKLKTLIFDLEKMTHEEYSALHKRAYKKYLEYILENSREFTPEEEKAFEKSLIAMAEPTGRNFFDL